MSESCEENVQTDVPSQNHQIDDSQNHTGKSSSGSTRDLDENSSQDGDVRLFEGEKTGSSEIKRDLDENSSQERDVKLFKEEKTGSSEITRGHDENENSGKDISTFDCVEDKKTNARKKNERSLWFLLKRDKIYRKKYILTVAYILSFLTLGWVEGQFGPTFPDILLISRTSLETGSLFFTMGTLGYLIGSLIMGVVFDKKILDRNLLMFLATMGYGVIIAIVPWCSLFEAMAFIHVMKGAFGGGLDTCGNAGLVVIWGSEGDSFFSALHFAFAFGGILSPLASAPYLMSFGDEVNNTFIDGNNSMMNFTNNNNNTWLNETKSNMSNLTVVTQNEQTSQIYIPYTMTTVLCVLTSLPFLVFKFMSLQKKIERQKGNPEEETTSKSESRLRIVGFINMVVYISVYVAVENTFAGFLTTFVVKELNWTNSQGSYITSGHWALFATGRFLGIFLVRFFSPAKMIFTYNTMMLISLLGFLLTSLHGVVVGVWAFTLLTGFSMSVVFPTVFMWTEQRFLRVTGKIASIFLVAASVGFMVNPLFLGMLMETFSPMWFSYLLFGETFLLMSLFFTGLCISRKISSIKPVQTEQEISILNEKGE